MSYIYSTRPIIMIKEYQLVESRKDGTHEFKGGEGDCLVCGKPRWQHSLDGFKPGNPPSMLSRDMKAVYRGPHPAWSKPGTLSRQDRREMELEQRLERRKIEEAIARDQEQFKRRNSRS